MMKRFPILVALLFGFFLMAGADGCSSDPNVEGAKLDLRNKDYDRALQNLDTALDKNPENAEAWELRGRVLSEQAFNTQDPEEHRQIILEMIEAFENAGRFDPTYQEDVTRGLRFAYANEFQRGIQAFERARNDESQYAVAAMYFDTAGDIQPDSAGAYVNQAYAWLNAGQPDNAIEPFEEALEAGDTAPETYRFLADLYRTNDRHDEAITLLEQASEMYPDNIDVQTELLNSYQIAGEVDKALERYQQAVDRDPENALFRYNYGSLLEQTGDHEAAREQLQRAVEIDPEYANAWYNIGASLINEAVDVNQQITELDEQLRANRDEMSDAEIDEMDARINGMVDERRSLFGEAVQPLERAKALLEAEGEQPVEVCRALYQSYVQTNQVEKAEGIAQCAGYAD
ncbi:MAG: tetratricopeptide repeat protein [Rhodothermales bacterium]|nr:tetratricopeptide repeat protein [Rhodothermales bacterium]